MPHVRSINQDRERLDDAGEDGGYLRTQGMPRNQPAAARRIGDLFKSRHPDR